GSGCAAADDLRRRREVARAGAGQGVPRGSEEMRWAIVAAFALIAAHMPLPAVASAKAGQAPDGAQIFARDCAACHDRAAGSRAPSPEILKKRSPEAILSALTA